MEESTSTVFLARLHELLPVTASWALAVEDLEAEAVERALAHHEVHCEWAWIDCGDLGHLLHHWSLPAGEPLVLLKASSSLVLALDAEEMAGLEPWHRQRAGEAFFDFTDLIVLGRRRRLVALFHPHCKQMFVELPVFVPEVVRFYSVVDAFGEFSNFAPYPIRLQGKLWPSSEHYFQAQKFAGTPHEEQVRQARTPMEAARMGRDRRRPLRADWESVKLEVMRQALRAKFSQHPDLEGLLLQTGEARLVEHTDRDDFWGDGGDGRGHNWLGRLLMELRESLHRGGDGESS